MSPFEREVRAEFDALGERMVERHLQAGLLRERRLEIALAWIAEQDAAWRDQDARTASEAKSKESAAQRIQIAVLILAAISALMSFLSWLLPRQ